MHHAVGLCGFSSTYCVPRDFANGSESSGETAEAPNSFRHFVGKVHYFCARAPIIRLCRLADFLWLD